MSDRPDFAEAVAALPSLPRDAGGPVFREPWEAQAFAMTVALYRRGLFTWPEWAGARRGDQAGAGGRRSRYWRYLLPALAQCARTSRRREGLSDAPTLRAIATPGTALPTAPRMACRLHCAPPISRKTERRMPKEHEEKFAAAVRHVGVAIAAERGASADPAAPRGGRGERPWRRNASSLVAGKEHELPRTVPERARRFNRIGQIPWTGNRGFVHREPGTLLAKSENYYPIAAFELRDA